MLDIGVPGRKTRKLDLWEVDIFYISLYEPENVHVLAAHVYYRALQAIPSLIRTWWMDCKDRQLSTAFSALTSTYFSPVLISAELDTVRESTSIASDDGRGGKSKRAQLEDENVSIKVASAIGEVGMVYTIDEQKMEMAVRLPAEYPLKSVEVRDVKRVGVAENKWRGWLFAVQQIVGTQVSRVVLLWQMNDKGLEWTYRRCARGLQEERVIAFRGPGRVCHLLLVRTRSSHSPLLY